MKDGWEMKKLKDVLKIQNGYAFNSKLFGKNEGLQLIRIRDLKDGYKTVVKYHGDYDKKYIVEKGDFLIGMDGEFECYEWKGVDSLLNQRVCRLEGFDESLWPKYLFHGINKYLKDIEDVTTYTTVKHISSRQIYNIEFPIPPLAEQKQIVTLLDAAFSKIDQAKANISTNIANAKELFQSKLNEIFSQKGDGWKKDKIENVTTIVTKGASPKWQGINYIDTPGVLFITSENVGEGEIFLKKRKYLELKFNEKQKKSILQFGDVLTNIVGASIGRTAVYDLTDLANINQAVCIMRCDNTVLHNYYLMYMLNSPFFKAILHDNEVNNARANLSLTFFKNLVIPFPDIDEQKNIVEEIRKLNDETSSLIKVLYRRFDNLEELKKSLLQKAFAGELT